MVNPKLYVVPQRIALALGLPAYFSVENDRRLPPWAAVHAALLKGSPECAGGCRNEKSAIAADQSLRDFGLAIDLAALKKKKAYTYFSPKHIFYAVYLSEKIGYARYISIYRQLQKHPEKRFHPIFLWFERWCNDEFRHGESFALIMRANPELLRGLNKWWIRFFLNAVYTTMYVRDHTRPLLHQAMGLESSDYDYRVFDITTEISRQVFPLTLDTNSPGYRRGLERLHSIAERDIRAKREGGVLNLVKRGGYAVAMAGTFLQLLLHPVHENQLPAQIRVAPAW